MGLLKQNIINLKGFAYTRCFVINFQGLRKGSVRINKRLVEEITIEVVWACIEKQWDYSRGKVLIMEVVGTRGRGGQ